MAQIGDELMTTQELTDLVNMAYKAVRQSDVAPVYGSDAIHDAFLVVLGRIIPSIMHVKVDVAVKEAPRESGSNAGRG